LIEVTLYYDEKAKYNPSAEEILPRFLALTEKEGVKLVKITRAELDQQEEKSVLAKIREIKPQLKGKVRASRGGALPISGSGKLNLGNTPVILVSRDKEQVYVFPCRMGEREYDVSSGIAFLSENLPATPSLKSETEEGISMRLEKDPTLLEEGLEYEGSEVETSTGKADLVFIDRAGKCLVVEVERDAGDSAVGQILRLGAGFESKMGFMQGSVRMGIVCLRINGNVLAAAKRAGIEVWCLDQRKDVFVKKEVGCPR
jgi:hypothetical protein